MKARIADNFVETRTRLELETSAVQKKISAKSFKSIQTVQRKFFDSQLANLRLNRLKFHEKLCFDQNNFRDFLPPVDNSTFVITNFVISQFG